MRAPVPLKSAQTLAFETAASVLPASMMATARSEGHRIARERELSASSAFNAGRMSILNRGAGAVTAEAPAVELMRVVEHSDANPPKLVEFANQEELDLFNVAGGAAKWNARTVWAVKQRYHLGPLDDVDLDGAEFGPMKREGAEHALVDELRAEFRDEVARLEACARAAASSQERLIYEGDLSFAHIRIEFLERLDVDRVLEQRFARKRHRKVTAAFERAQREFQIARHAEGQLNDSIRLQHHREIAAAELASRRAENAMLDAKAALERSRQTLGELSFD